VLIERRSLVRECVARCLASVPGYKVASFPSIESWLEHSEVREPSLIAFCPAGERGRDGESGELALLAQVAGHVPAVVMSDIEDFEHIVKALDNGARGYIPTSLSLEVVIEAIRLVRAGGIFVPASSIIAARRANDRNGRQESRTTGMFTARQAEVVQALRSGKANKIIAHELKMRESTVKVHVRNIMKKLNAKNRTEVALMANGLLAYPDANGGRSPT
jgi:DNA-binding NarL/FixJ family response regulator